MTSQDGATALQLDRDHVFHSWSAQAHLDPLAIAGGLGSTVWDHDGRRYLDFSSQLVNVNIGHQHPRVVAAIQEQAATLTTIAPATANLTRGQAAERILSHAPDGFSSVFFTNGGADANENAIRMARLHTGRDKVVSAYRSYHGNTGAAVVATGDWRRVPNEYARGHVHHFGPFLYRTEFWATTPEQESERALRHLERVIQAEGPASVAAILLETIPGTAGVLVPPPGYLAGVRAIADRYGILLILDEVMCGLRPDRSVVRVRRLRRPPRPHHLRQGRQLGLRPRGRRRDQRPDRQDVRRRGVPRGPDLLGPPARHGVDRRDPRRDGRRGHRRERGDDRHRRARTRARRPRRAATRSWARCAGSGCSGPSSSCATRPPTSRSRPR